VTDALHDSKTVMATIEVSANACLVKPIHKAMLLEALRGLRLID
jgi:AmiR/NasT family two-component response regulator